MHLKQLKLIVSVRHRAGPGESSKHYLQSASQPDNVKCQGIILQKKGAGIMPYMHVLYKVSGQNGSAHIDPYR
jgi:hypothetical protein